MAGFRHIGAIRVLAWGETVGAAALDPQRKSVAFEYADAWRQQGIELAPLTMPVAGARIHRFPDLEPSAFRGLPGLLADALPDRFGNQLINAWMERHGTRAEVISVLDRLAYMGARTMGALTFQPVRGPRFRNKEALFDVGLLVDTARRAVTGSLASDRQAMAALNRVISVGTSAGGARAKAVLAISRDRTRIMSGEFDAPDGYDHWLLKFDGMGMDAALGDSQEYGRIEFAYARMAQAAGITMMPCDLFEENGRAHFMTRRFDRDGNERVHVQSFCALTHRSFNETGVHSYEALLQTALDLGLGDTALTEIFRRMAFNVAAANHDDHTKNFAFLLPRGGAWTLAPAFDVTFSFSESSPWVNQHQMSVNGRFRDITMADLRAVADRYAIAGTRAALTAVMDAVADWARFAAEADVSEGTTRKIAAQHVLR
jgi:serine/threonine-protein kinase HipA